MGLPLQSSKGIGCIVLFALPFAAVGAWAGFSSGKQLHGWSAARSWQETPAIVERAQLKTHDGDDSTTYSVHASYTYSVQGATYASDRVWFVDGSDNLGDFHERTYARLRRARESGQATTCFVDPDDPTNAVLTRELRPLLLLFKLTFFLLFGGVGFGLLAAIPIVRRSEAKEAAARALYPDEPWRWKEEWTTNRLRSSDKNAMWGRWILAAFWNLLSWPAAVLGWDEVAKNPWVLFVLVFPLVGLVLAGSALRATLRRVRFGESELDLESFPVPVGGRLTGRVLTAARLDEAKEIRLRLNCHRQSSSGKKSSVRLAWQDDASVRPRDVHFDGRHTSIPVAMEIPAGAASCDEDGIRWELEVQATIPGTDFATTFKLPVFRVGDHAGTASESAPPPPPWPGKSMSSALSALPERREWPRGIAVEPLPGGGHRYRFGRNRYPSGTIGLTLFVLIWFGATYALWRADAPVLAPIAFGLMGVFLLFAVLNLWLRVREIDATPGGLVVRSGMVGLGREREIPADRIRSLDPKTGTQFGNKLLFQIKADTGERSAKTLATQLDSLGFARELVERIERDLERNGHHLIGVRRAG